MYRSYATLTSTTTTEINVRKKIMVEMIKRKLPTEKRGSGGKTSYLIFECPMKNECTNGWEIAFHEETGWYYPYRRILSCISNVDVNHLNRYLQALLDSNKQLHVLTNYQPEYHQIIGASCKKRLYAITCILSQFYHYECVLSNVKNFNDFQDTTSSSLHNIIKMLCCKSTKWLKWQLGKTCPTRKQ